MSIIIKNWSMLSVSISSYGCSYGSLESTREA